MEAINALNMSNFNNSNNVNLGIRNIDFNLNNYKPNQLHNNNNNNKKQLPIPRSFGSKPNKSQIDDPNFSRNPSKTHSLARLKPQNQASTPLTTFYDDQVKLKGYNTENIKKVRILKRFLKINDTSAAALAIGGLLLAVIEYEIFYDDTDKERYTSTDFCILLRSFVSITTGIIVVLLIIHSSLSFQLWKRTKTDQNTDLEENIVNLGYFSSSKFKQLILEIIVVGAHCPPNWDQVFEFHQLGAIVSYSFDGLMMVWMLLRFYLVFRLFGEYSKWTDELAQHCCEPEGCEANTSFALKAVLKEKPFTSLLFMTITSTIIFGLAVRHFERPYYYDYSPDSNGFQDYSYIWNGMWLIMITMMTVGYGDFYPHTHMGRFVCILACFWGVFLVSMMVVTLTVVSTFDRKESRAYAILFRLNIKQGIRKKAVFVITLAIRKAGLKKKFQKGKIDKAQFIRDNILLKSKLSVHLQYFLDEAAKISAYEISSEESLRQMTEKIDRDLDEVKEVLLSMIEIEKQLNEIQESQLIVANAMNQCINFTNNLEDHLNDFKENIVRKIKIIQKLKENQGELIPDYFKKKKKSKTRSPETDIKRKSSKENFLRKNLNIKEGELIQLD